MRRPFFSPSFLLFSLLVTSSAFAQSAAPAAPPELVFKSQAQLVLVPVVVNDKTGHHIAGLKRDAFKIEEKGKPRTATIFEEVKTVGASAELRSPATLLGRSNFTNTDVTNARVTIVVLDRLNHGLGVFDASAGANTRLWSRPTWAEDSHVLVDFLTESLAATLPADEPVAIYGLSRDGLIPLHAVSTDTAVLLEALHHVQLSVGPHKIADWQGAGERNTHAAAYDTAQRLSDFLGQQTYKRPPFYYSQNDLAQTTLEAMAQVAHASQALPVRKTMLWVGGSLNFMMSESGGGDALGALTAVDFKETLRTLAAAQVAAYPMGFRNGVQNRTMLEFASVTGGKACLDWSKTADCIRNALADSRSYYLLGYYLSADEMKPGWRSLKVSVDAAGARVQARDGFFVAGPSKDAPEALQRQFEEALLSPVEFTGVRLNVREVVPGAGVLPVARGRSRHEFAIGVLGNSIMVDTQNGNAVDISVVAAAFDRKEKNCGQTDHHLATKVPQELLNRFRETGVSINQSLDLPPGSYEIRFAVRDNESGEMGSVIYPLEVK